MVLLAGVVVLAVLWRLSLGPVSLGFVSGPIESVVNAGLTGMRVELSDAVIERAQDSGRPRLRFRDVRLVDTAGGLIARAPRAAVSIDESALLTGRVVPRRLELIGPQILARRTADGGLELGFGSQSGAPNDTGAAPKADKAPGSGSESSMLPMSGRGLMAFIERELLTPASGGAGALNAIVVSDASVSLYDEANQSIWYAPSVNLNFERAAYGLTLAADAEIAAGGETTGLDVTAAYRTETQRMSVTARVRDLVPAHVAGRVFALARLAEVNLPLSGEVRVELSDDGTVNKAEAVFTAAAGHVNFPDFISKPILVDEGVLQLSYEPQSGDIVIGDSAVYIGGSQAALTGRLTPVVGDDRQLEALGIALHARELSPDTGRPASDALAIDRMDLEGTASFKDARVDIDKLAIRAGDAGINLHGSFAEGPEAVSIDVDGTLHDLPIGMLKELWPPVVAPGARQWISENVLKGVMPTGNFTIDMPSAILARALRDEVIPDKHVNFSFTLAGVETRYYGHLPVITGAAGEGTLRGDSFDLSLERGRVTVPSGKEISFVSGQMHVGDLVTRGTRARVQVTTEGPAQGFLELINQKPLEFVSESGFDVSRLTGETRTSLDLTLPLLRDIPGDQVAVKATATIDDVRFPDIADGKDIDGGTVSLEVTTEGMTGGGDITVNGVDARVDMTSQFGGDGPEVQHLVVKATLDDADRDRLGTDMNDFVRGPVPVTLEADIVDGVLDTAHARADLSRAQLRVEPVRWQRPPIDGTSATLDLAFGDGGGLGIRNLVISGKDLEVRGRLSLNNAGRIVAASLPTVKLGPGNDVALKATRRSDGALALEVTGAAFDARPVIHSLFNKTAPAEDEKGFVVLEASIDAVQGYRGALINGVNLSADVRDGSVTRLDMTGRHRDNAAVNMTVRTQGDGSRALRLNSGNGGAILRACDLYSRVGGGRLGFTADLGRPGSAAIRNGRLRLRNFVVTDEPALVRFDGQGRPVSPQQAAGSRRFTSLTVPFSVDQHYVRIGDSLLQGPTIGGSAHGSIRKDNGALDISGTFIPAYALNSILSAVPILGEVLMGGKGQGLFGVTFALRGTMADPEMVFNPVSALAPGFLRKLFEFQSDSPQRGSERAPRIEDPATLSR